MKDFEQFWNIVNQLRDPQRGCPWDIKQTSESLIPNFIEELYEVIESIENGNSEHLKEELGDLMLHILMQIRIAEERGDFKMQDVWQNINRKLISRHPHVFGEANDDRAVAEDIKVNWERIKNKQKKRESVLDGIPKSMPALIYAQRMQEKAAAVGFDWDNIQDVICKVEEELEELKEAVSSGNSSEIEDEIGDMFFSLVNFARKNGLDAESVLKKAAKKFYARFRTIEEYHKKNNENIYDSDMEKLDELWEKSKNKV